MNPLKIIRWKVLIVIALLGFAVHKFALPRYLDDLVTKRLEEQFQAEASVDSVEMSVLKGTLIVKGVKVPDPTDRSRYLFTADGMEIEVDPVSMLARKIVAKRIELNRPQVAAVRRDGGEDDDGFAWDLDDIDPREVADKAKDLYGKYEKAKDTWGKIRDVLAKIKAKREIEAERRGELELLRQMTILPEVGPRLVFERVTVDGIGLSFPDYANVPKLIDGKLEGKNISNEPKWLLNPMDFVVGATFDDATTGPAFGLRALLHDGGDNLNLRGLIERLDIERIKEFVQDSIPVELISGKISATWNGDFQGLTSFDLRPVLVFENLKIRAKPGISQIAGFLPESLAKEVCDCGTFALTDLRVYGDIFEPKFDMGSTLSKLMQVGGKAFAEAYGKKMVEHLLGQLSGTIPGGEGLLGLPLALFKGGDGDLSKALDQGVGSVLGMVGGQGGAPLDFEETFGDVMKGGLGNVFGGQESGGGGNPLGGVTDILKGLGGAPKPDASGRPKPAAPDAVGDLLKGVLGGDKPKDGEAKPDKPLLPGGLGDLLGGKKPKPPESRPGPKKP